MTDEINEQKQKELENRHAHGDKIVQWNHATIQMQTCIELFNRWCVNGDEQRGLPDITFEHDGTKYIFCDLALWRDGLFSHGRREFFCTKIADLGEAHLVDITNLQYHIIGYTEKDERTTGIFLPYDSPIPIQILDQARIAWPKIDKEVYEFIQKWTNKNENAKE